MTLPEDHRRRIEELERLEREATTLVEGLSPAQLDWQPDGGRAWSVAQCVDHLSRSNAIYLPALAAAADRARESGRTRRGPLRANWLGRWFVRSLEPPARMKLKAPLAEMQPPSRHERGELLARFSARQREVIELLRSTGDLDLNGIRFANPMLGGRRPFNVATGFDVIAAHERRHLWQARRVTAHPDFPR